MSNRTTILFDLDGTLLEMRTEEFIKQYLVELGKHVGDRYDTKQLYRLIWDATTAVIMNQDATKTNEDVFAEYFLAHSGLKREEIWPVFDEFYAEVFPGLSHLTFPSPWGKKLVEAAKAQGYRVAVATNPVFPREAIHSRLAWIDLSPQDFELVTVYEESHFTKPHPAFFQEVCDRLGVAPTSCIMIGNHMQEDMVAKKLGIKTFLVTNYMEDRGEPVYEVDQRGTLEDLYQAITTRTGIFAK